MKKPSKVLEAIITGLSGALTPVLAEKYAEILGRISPAETRRNVVLTLYPIFAGELARLAAGTKTPLDDDGVEAVVEALTTIATADGFDLPRLTMTQTPGL